MSARQDGKQEQKRDAATERKEIFPKTFKAYEALYNEFAKAEQRFLKDIPDSKVVTPVDKKEDQDYVLTREDIETRLRKALPLIGTAPRSFAIICVDLILAYLIVDEEATLDKYTTRLSKPLPSVLPEENTDVIEVIVEKIHAVGNQGSIKSIFLQALNNSRYYRIEKQLLTAGYRKAQITPAVIASTSITSPDASLPLQDRPISLRKKIKGKDNPLYGISLKEFSAALQKAGITGVARKLTSFDIGVIVCSLTAIIGLSMLFSDGTPSSTLTDESNTSTQRAGYVIVLIDAVVSAIGGLCSINSCLSDPSYQAIDGIFLNPCRNALKRGPAKEIEKIAYDLYLLMHVRYFGFPRYPKTAAPPLPPAHRPPPAHIPTSPLPLVISYSSSAADSPSVLSQPHLFAHPQTDGADAVVAERKEVTKGKSLAEKAREARQPWLKQLTQILGKPAVVKKPAAGSVVVDGEQEPNPPKDAEGSAKKATYGSMMDIV